MQCFWPKHPATKPKMERIRKAEEVLNIEELVDEAIKEQEIREIGVMNRIKGNLYLI